MTDIPPGFKLVKDMDPLMSALAPVYGRQEESGVVTLRLQIGPQHCNLRGECHGGTWATMADMLMGLSVGYATGKGGPTISMSIDFLAAAKPGQWVEGRARVLRSTPNLGFAECEFTADGEPALRASGVFRRKVPAESLI